MPASAGCSTMRPASRCLAGTAGLITFQHDYDVLGARRPCSSRPAAAPRYWPSKRSMAEGQANARGMNLLGRVYQQFDGAGVVTNIGYDFKGNLFSSSRQLLQLPELYRSGRLVDRPSAGRDVHHQHHLRRTQSSGHFDYARCERDQPHLRQGAVADAGQCQLPGRGSGDGLRHQHRL